MNRASIGIGVTYYNEGNLLTRSIEQIFQGNDVPDEVLVYDDASDFPARDYIAPGLPVRVIRAEENKGPGYGRNLILTELQSDYLHFHDSDDSFHPGWCESIRRIINKKMPDIIVTGLQYQSGDQSDLGGFLHALPTFPTTNDLTLMAVRWGLSTQEVTFRRSLGMAAGGILFRDELPMCEDSEFHVRLTQFCKTYEFLHEPVAIRNMRANSLSMDYDGQRIEHIINHYRMANLLAKYLPPKYTQELSETVVSLASIAAKRGEYEVAKQGFILAKQLGNPTFQYMRPGYRFIAKLCSPMWAERLTSIYRHLMPETLRQRIAKSV